MKKYLTEQEKIDRQFEYLSLASIITLLIFALSANPNCSFYLPKVWQYLLTTI